VLMIKQPENIMANLQILILNNMKTELYRKVIIKSKTDLPKEEGEYIAHNMFNNIISNWASRNKNQWMERIDWYLLPVDLPTDEELEDEISLRYIATPSPITSGIAFRSGFNWLRDKLLNR
jgi:DNA modification methylase